MRKTYLDQAPPDSCEIHGILKIQRIEHPYIGATVWRGKSLRPERYSFKNIDARETWITRQKEAADQVASLKTCRLQERKDAAQKAADAIQVGTILHYSWGYEQTNCQFFQVIAKSGRKITIREIASKSVGNPGGSSMSDYVSPVRDAFLENEPPIDKIITGYGVSMPHGCASPCPEDGKFYSSWYA